MLDRFPIVKILSDYTPSEHSQANYLHIIMDEDNDIILEHLEEMINKQIERNQKKFEEL